MGHFGRPNRIDTRALHPTDNGPSSELARVTAQERDIATRLATSFQQLVEALQLFVFQDGIEPRIRSIAGGDALAILRAKRPDECIAAFVANLPVLVALSTVEPLWIMLGSHNEASQRQAN